jgi:hypothetical protein
MLQLTRWSGVFADVRLVPMVVGVGGYSDKWYSGDDASKVAGWWRDDALGGVISAGGATLLELKVGDSSENEQPMGVLG